jgi:glucokinase
MKRYLGIDIGGTKIAGGIVTDAGIVIRYDDRPTEAHRGGPAVLQLARELGASLVAVTPGVFAVGVGSGGQIDPSNGIVVSATDVLPGWTGVDLKQAFHAATALPVSADNDVNALALGEVRFGAAKGLRTVVFLALGTGVGGALVIDGKVHHGAHFAGGEFGHILLNIDPSAREDMGGSTGTLEAYCSGSGLARTWREMGGDNPAATGRDIAKLAAQDPSGLAALAIKQTGESLGFGLVSLANAIDPEMIVIGGGMAALGDRLLEPARRVMRELALPGPASCPIVRAGLGKYASVIGAASLAMK